ncbi:DgyrCDS2896 [Dimorphilus gyrociliatus]|uniref:DgyrCDS2896 n=1 Tax=Dimorphilus gyrociliatus TaxID=2664684 RepID=A0A7I8VEB9_9ANNE|nr:DgyrCDS2896 [Dimorphilus gyrociliatus]
MPANTITTVVSFKKQFRAEILNKFTTLAVGYLDGDNREVLVTCGEDGVLHVYTIDNSTDSDQCLKKIKTLDSKCSSIQCICIAEVTRFGSNDLIVADSKGHIVVFFKEQIVCRKKVSDYPLSSLAVYNKPNGMVVIVAADIEGMIVAFNPYIEFWKFHISNIPIPKGPSSLVKILAIHIAHLKMSENTVDYILISDTARQLLFLRNGKLVHKIILPFCATAISSGYYQKSSTNTEIAIASENGSIHLLNNTEIILNDYANLNVPVKKMKTIRVTHCKDTVDTLICTGNFDSVFGVRDGTVSQYETTDWIENTSITDSSSLYLGSKDNSLFSIKLDLDS